jgi:uncharacterized protein YaeQ
LALKATIFKAALHVADMGRNYYHDHALTIARHPSETDERMMVRLLAFALHAHERLAFGQAIGSDDEPDLWRRDLTGAIEDWIDVGLPDGKRIRNACGRSAQVFVYGYGGHGADTWWNQIETTVERSGNLTVMKLPMATSRALARLARRNMRLYCTVQDGQIWLADETDSVEVELAMVKSPAPARPEWT